MCVPALFIFEVGVLRVQGPFAITCTSEAEVPVARVLVLAGITGGEAGGAEGTGALVSRSPPDAKVTGATDLV